jgi:ectoine hydroxylase-related dioxygenase (phytanoyl-CoA dioxygenase family)
LVSYDVEHHVTFDARDADVAQRGADLFRVHGSLVLEHVLDPVLVSELHADFIANYSSKSSDDIADSCLSVGANRYMFTIEVKPPWSTPALYAAARIMPVVRDLLGSNCVLMSLGAVCAFPGAQVQHVHRDHPALFGEANLLGPDFPPYALHVVVPLVDLDEETGTTALWEGSHRVTSTRDRERWARDGLEGAVMPWPKRGDCYLMDYRLRHAGTPNLSDRPRPILYLIYTRRWFIDRENYDVQSRLRLTPEEFDLIPEEHLCLFPDARPDGHPRAASPNPLDTMTRAELERRLSRFR